MPGGRATAKKAAKQAKNGKKRKRNKSAATLGGLMLEEDDRIGLGKGLKVDGLLSDVLASLASVFLCVGIPVFGSSAVDFSGSLSMSL